VARGQAAAGGESGQVAGRGRRRPWPGGWQRAGAVAPGAADPSRRTGRGGKVRVAQSPVVLGLDFGGTKIAIAVCAPDGEQLASATVASGGELGARASFERGIETARDLLASAATGRELAAVGVSTFGIPFDDRVELAPAIEGWGELGLGKELRAAFPGAAVAMATDAKAAAQAEARFGALAGCDPAVYLNLGTGLSAAIVTGGRVLSGANGAAGEIGYNLRARADVGVPLAARVLLEDMISGQALARRAAGHTRAGQPMEAGEVFQASRDDPELDRLLTDFVAELAFHVVNLAICLNPVRIAVGGGMVASWDRLRPGLAEALSAGVPFPPELVPARFPFQAPLLGAIALAADLAQARAPGGAAPSTAVSSTPGVPRTLHVPSTLSEGPPS
jgi:predicted NBD/HSP70 family sugar kinase